MRVVVALVPIALTDSEGMTVPMREALDPGLVMVHVPSPILRIPVPPVVFA